MTVGRPGRAVASCTVILGALAFTACSAAPDGQVDAAAGAGPAVSDSLPTPYLSTESGLLDPGIGQGGPCPGSPAGNALFCQEMVWDIAPARRVLYSWTTAEDVAELRRDHVLLTRTETAALGRSSAFTSMAELAALGNAPENQLLTKLPQELFTKVRHAWSNAWAARMGWPGEDYGDQLLRIVLKREAWILVVSDRVGIAVIDHENQRVPIADAVAHGERIGAVYFYEKDFTGSSSFQTCSGGYREFIVGNEAMVEEWSLGTQELRDQLEWDADLIGLFLTYSREMPPTVAPEAFNQYAVCSWDHAGETVLDRYVQALSIPSQSYAPLPAELATLGDTLRQSLFDPDPLTVKPGG